MRIIQNPAVILLLILILFGCTTNPYTEEDFQAGKKPLTPFLTIITQYVPGLPQLLHGEYKEAAIIAGGVAGGLSLGLLDTYVLNDGPLENNTMRPLTLAGASLMAGSYLYSIGDGWVISVSRDRQYRKFNTQQQREEAWRQAGYPEKIAGELDEEILPLIRSRQWERTLLFLEAKRQNYREDYDLLNESYTTGLQTLVILLKQADTLSVMNALSETDDRAAKILGNYLGRMLRFSRDPDDYYVFKLDSLERMKRFLEEREIAPSAHREEEGYTNLLIPTLKENRQLYNDLMEMLSKSSELSALKRKLYLGERSNMLPEDELAFLFSRLYQLDYLFADAEQELE